MIKRVLAEILALFSALLLTTFAAGILGGLVGMIFLPIFLIAGVVFYGYVRSWMFDVFQLRYRDKRPRHS